MTFLDPSSLIAACVAVGGIGGWLVFHLLFSPRRKLIHRLRRLSRTDIGNAQDGMVKLVGRVRLLGEPLIAPISGRRGACYQAVVLESGPDEGERAIITEVRCADFLLDDGTGVARVRAQGASLEIVHDRHRRSGVGRRAPAGLEAFLQRHGEKSTRWKGLLSRHLNYSEGVLEEGEEVVVCGTARWEAETDPRRAIGYRDCAGN